MAELRLLSGTLCLRLENPRDLLEIARPCRNFAPEPKGHMRWSREGANALLQVRCTVLNGADVQHFKRWYPPDQRLFASKAT